jgi:hypothetical protein
MLTFLYNVTIILSNDLGCILVKLEKDISGYNRQKKGEDMFEVSHATANQFSQGAKQYVTGAWALFLGAQRFVVPLELAAQYALPYSGPVGKKVLLAATGLMAGPGGILLGKAYSAALIAATVLECVEAARDMKNLIIKPVPPVIEPGLLGSMVSKVRDFASAYSFP